jgi:lipooligosaccharide transport system permease protein
VTRTGLSALPPLRVVERNAVTYRRHWPLLLSGFFEPVLFLLAMGMGVGHLIGRLPGPHGSISYQQFVAPGLLAVAAMNGSIFDTTIDFFIKYEYAHTYDAMLASPLRVIDVATGELSWALLRTVVYGTSFLVALVALGLVGSWWSVLVVPAAALMGWGFAGAGLASTTWMRSFLDFDFVNLAIIPMFLFSATFFPLDSYPGALRWIVRATPLYQGVAIDRGLLLGNVGLATVGHAAYLAVMGAVGVRLAARRLGRRLQP